MVRPHFDPIFQVVTMRLKLQHQLSRLDNICPYVWTSMEILINVLVTACVWFIHGWVTVKGPSGLPWRTQMFLHSRRQSLVWLNCFSFVFKRKCWGTARFRDFFFLQYDDKFNLFNTNSLKLCCRQNFVCALGCHDMLWPHFPGASSKF